MHILLPFDIVPVDSQVPQSAFGFSPSSERDVSVDVSIESVAGVESMDEIRQKMLDIVRQSDIDTVVIGYTEESFIDSVFSESTPRQILDQHGCPVVLVP